ncbi:DUF6884 domain-containing protein [Vibrio owensii]|uniref:DUF6884 domain-containing protein n=1 Tax=Vibrio owensii CAIM 1854 = LMG 25443 TaxID=1229493 RepID=A0A0C1WAN7_9VIBR|nr:DUF6884 domain-containing protein [Vibrio owensii]KIF53367.1 hypothetical protein H735_10630 [Vibrio owensii CAIM 1854 = LMG 25443]
MIAPNNKPVLIIGCSDKKIAEPARAIDLYQGGFYTMLRSNIGTEDPTDYFDIKILSGEHGLINSTDVIAPYEKRMCCRNDKLQVAEYVERHSQNALKQLTQASGERALYVVLSNDYLSMFKSLMGNKLDAVLAKYHSHYICESHRGIGDLRGALKRIINHVVKEPRDKPERIWFRSGVANMAEIGFIASGNDVGTSLAHVNSNKQTDLLSVILDSTKTGRKVFVDNGLITLLNKGKEIDTDWVFAEYSRLIASLKPRHAKNVWIVVPDDVASNENAVAILRKHSRQIRQLAKKCNVILPIHRAPDIRQHALSLMSELKFGKVWLGIPCLTKKNLDLALSTREIDQLLTLKSPTGEMLFPRVHFFGMSEATYKSKLNPRLLLADLHNAEVSLDCCRTASVFGKTTNGLRKGSQLAENLKEDHIKQQVTKSKGYQEWSFNMEFHNPESSPFVTADFYDMINTDQILLWWDVYNLAMKNHPMLQESRQWSENEIDDAIEVAWNLTSQRTVDVILFEELKKLNWARFKHHVEQLTELSGFDARFNAIKELFMTNKKMSVQVQMPLRLCA